ncbi:uncharacterized protein LOC114718604 isoform X2 [Neltuma alba]|uniref:uncharacterized protein LOC114718604 isoform X2 n=1 Tax=Neltuma alba TaxID=207710 RepID=UPI0010A596B9|nr:uncharacterized protein LOC114718604 isoform X2 [Prosopis alba]
MEIDQVTGLDPEKHAPQNLNVSSLDMMQDKTDAPYHKGQLSDALGGGELKDRLDGGKSQRHAAEESGLRNSKIEDQPESSQVAGTNPEKSFGNADVPSPSLGAEESENDFSSGKSPLCGSVETREPEDSLIDEENCGDAIVGHMMIPLLPQESQNTRVEMADKPEKPELINDDVLPVKIEESKKDYGLPMEIEESKKDVSYDQEPPCSPVAVVEPKGLTGEGNRRDATADLVTNPLPPQELCYSGAEMDDQMELTHVAGNKPEKLELRNMEVPSSSMEIDGSNDKEPPSTSLTPRESKSWVTGEEQCRDATMAPITDPSVAQEMDIPSSSMATEHVDVPYDMGPPCSSEAPGKPEAGLTGEETCGDATMALSDDPLPPQQSSNSEAEMGEKRNESLVGVIPVGDDTLRCEALTLTITTGEGQKELEALSEKVPVGTSEVQHDMKDKADIIESCAAEMGNASGTPCPSASGEKDGCLSEKGVNYCAVGMEVSKGSNADIGKDFTNGCSDVLAPESMGGGSPPQPSSAEGNHVESLESDEVINNSPVQPENVLKESEGDITDGNPVTEVNLDMLASASTDRVLSPCSAAEGDQVNSDVDVTNNADHFMLENASAESKADTTDGKDVTEGFADVLATVSVDHASPPSSPATEGYRVGSSETDVANIGNDGKQENALEDMDQPCSSAAEGEIEERMSEKDLTAGTGVQQESEEHTVTGDGRGTVPDLEVVNTEAPDNRIPSSHPSPAVEGDNNAQSLPEKELAESSVASEVKEHETDLEGDNDAQSLPEKELAESSGVSEVKEHEAD